MFCIPGFVYDLDQDTFYILFRNITLKYNCSLFIYLLTGEKSNYRPILDGETANSYCSLLGDITHSK
jgi:hypothetical protein